MRKILFTAAAFFAVIFIASSQDQTAKNILDEVSQKTKAYTSITAKFTYSMVNEDEGIDEGYSGSITLKGEKYNVYIGDIPMRMISDGKTIWSYMEDVNEVTISNVEDQDSELLDPAKIFSLYEQGFEYEYKGEAIENGKSVYKIDLIPETDDFDFSKLSVVIDKSDMMIASATMTDDMGTAYEIKTQGVETNQPVDDSIFTFNPSDYVDIEVIDFR